MKTPKPRQLKRSLRLCSYLVTLLWFLFSVLGAYNFSFAYCGPEKASTKECCCGQKFNHCQTCPLEPPSKNVVSSQTHSPCSCNITTPSSSQEERLHPSSLAGGYSILNSKPLLTLTPSLTAPLAIYHNPLHPQLIPSSGFLRSPPQG